MRRTNAARDGPPSLLTSACTRAALPPPLRMTAVLGTTFTLSQVGSPRTDVGGRETDACLGRQRRSTETKEGRSILEVGPERKPLPDGT